MNESMEITNEIKAKVFAQYLGQEMIHDGKKSKTKYECTGSTVSLIKDSDRDFLKFQLLLKPLSAISNYDLLEVSKIIRSEDNLDGDSISIIQHKQEFVKEFLKTERPFITLASNIPLAYQFLQSRGYDLPHYLLGGKTLHECNLCIYE